MFPSMSKRKRQRSITRKDKTLIIIDWDDTFFPTSWTVSQGINISNPFDRANYNHLLSQFDECVSDVIRLLVTLGEVIILTNATSAWVQTSSSVLPLTNTALNGVKIISARKYQKDIPVEKWKSVTLPEILKKRKYTNIISVGDSDYERDAVINVYKSDINTKSVYKTVKLLDNPGIITLIRQQSILLTKLESVCKVRAHKDILFIDVPYYSHEGTEVNNSPY